MLAMIVTPEAGQVWRSVDPPHRFVRVLYPATDGGQRVMRVDADNAPLHIMGQRDVWDVRPEAFRTDTVSRCYILHNPRKEAPLVGNSP